MKPTLTAEHQPSLAVGTASFGWQAQEPENYS